MCWESTNLFKDWISFAYNFYCLVSWIPSSIQSLFTNDAMVSDYRILTFMTYCLILSCKLKKIDDIDGTDTNYLILNLIYFLTWLI